MWGPYSAKDAALHCTFPGITLAYKTFALAAPVLVRSKTRLWFRSLHWICICTLVFWLSFFCCSQHLGSRTVDKVGRSLHLAMIEEIFWGKPVLLEDQHHQNLQLCAWSRGIIQLLTGEKPNVWLE